MIPGHSLQTKSICLCKIYTNNIYVSIIEKLCSNRLMWASNHGIQPSMANYELLFTSKCEDFNMTPIQPNILGCLFPNVMASCHTFCWSFDTISQCKNNWFHINNSCNNRCFGIRFCSLFQCYGTDIWSSHRLWNGKFKCE